MTNNPHGIKVGQAVRFADDASGERFKVVQLKANSYDGGSLCAHVVDGSGGRIVAAPSELRPAT